MKATPSSRVFTSEDALVSFLRQKVPRPGATLGIGDDAAVLSIGGKNVVVTTDSLVENVHFKREWVNPKYLGKKAARSNLSDLAAMGAVPQFALISLVLPKEFYTRAWISKLYDGFLWALNPHRAEIVGGNISSGDTISITLTLTGFCDGKPLVRSAARAGDSIFCTGILGKAAWEVENLLKKKKSGMKVLPPDRVAFAQKLAKSEYVHTCIDLSDGLAADLARLCVASNSGAEIHERNIPIARSLKKTEAGMHVALHGGEDYELLFTVPESGRGEVTQIARHMSVPVNEIGTIVSSPVRVVLVKSSGVKKTLRSAGWDHIARP